MTYIEILQRIKSGKQFTVFSETQRQNALRIAQYRETPIHTFANRYENGKPTGTFEVVPFTKG